MFEKNMRLLYLYDFYQPLLDEHTKSIMQAYYEDDLSLAEIALCEGISRQGVRHVIKKCEEQLLRFEEKLKLAENSERQDACVSELYEIADILISKDCIDAQALGCRIQGALRRLKESDK